MIVSAGWLAELNREKSNRGRHKLRQIQETVRRANRMGPLDRVPRRRSEVDELTAADRDMYEELRVWRKRTAQARPTDSSLVLTRRSMIQLARLRPRPRDVDELSATGLLEPWRVSLYGDELVAILKRRGR